MSTNSRKRRSKKSSLDAGPGKEGDKLFDPLNLKANNQRGQVADTPIRSHLFNSVASRGRSATFWADLQ